MTVCQRAKSLPRRAETAASAGRGCALFFILFSFSLSSVLFDALAKQGKFGKNKKHVLFFSIRVPRGRSPRTGCFAHLWGLFLIQQAVTYDL